VNKVLLAGSLVVGTIVVIGALKPDEPKTAQTARPFDCGLRRIELFVYDQQRRQYVEKVLDAIQDGKAWHMEAKDNENMADAALRRELKDGDEYLKHSECTEYVDQIRDVITDLHKIEADWQRVQADLKRNGRE
jgi:hypothetical protein